MIFFQLDTGMDVTMLFVSLLVASVFRCISCKLTFAQQSKLLFQLLKPDDRPADITYPATGGRRNVPHDQLPVDDLLEDPSEMFNPRPNELNAEYLRQQLGREFRPRYMSVRDPRNLKNPLIKYVKGRPKGPRPKFLRLLRKAKLQDGSTVRLNVSADDRRRIQKYLWKLTHCPVADSWRFLGSRFFPPWVNVGKCTNKRSCSMPEGMTCKPKTKTELMVLRFYCASYQDRDTCRWIPVKYPVIGKCACSC